MKIEKIADVKEEAHKVITQFQTGKITKLDLYAKGVELTLRFNALMDKSESDPTYYLAEDTAEMLHVIKYISC